MTIPYEIAVATSMLIGALLVFGWQLSEKRRSEQESRESTPPMLSPDTSAVLEALRSSVVLLDPNCLVVEASASAHELGLVHNNRIRTEKLEDLVRLVSQDGVLRQEVLTVERNGRTPVHLFVRAARLPSNLILLLVEDRTREHLVEALRRDFVANSSHELKTPIGAIRILAEAVEEASDDPEAVNHFAARMQAEAERLTHLVQQMLDLSRVQNDDIIGDHGPVNLNDVATEAVNHSETEAQRKQVTVSVRGDTGLLAFGNHPQLVSAVSNLVKNAVAYSSDGAEVSVSLERKGNDVAVVVADTGIGFEAGESDRIFERFYRVDPSRNRNTGGTGLGLSIVKHVAASHGGSVEVWSQSGTGSTFTLTLPTWKMEEGTGNDQDPVG